MKQRGTLSVPNPPVARRSPIGLVLAVAVGLGAGLTVLVSPPEHWVALVGILTVFVVFCGYQVWHRFELTRDAVLPDLLTMYLFNLLTAKTMTLVGVLFQRDAMSAAPLNQDMLLGGFVPIKYQVQAELMFLLAAAIFFLVGRRMEGGRPLALWVEPDSRMLWYVYLAGMGFYILVGALGLSSSLGEMTSLSRLIAIGTTAVLLSGKSEYAIGRPKSVVVYIALLPLFALALRSGMKGEVALVAMPILLPIIRRMNFRGMVFLASFIAFVLLFLFPFSQAWREANWFKNRDVGIGEVSTIVFQAWDRDGIIVTAGNSMTHWIARGSSSQMGGLVMYVAERDGFLGPELIKGLATIFIPRVLWPEKPSYAPGAWFTWYLGHASSPDSARTSTATMLPTELYWMFGLPGVMIGMGVIGLLYQSVWRYLLSLSSTGIVPSVALFAILMKAGSLEGAHTIYALTTPVILVIYIRALDIFQRLVSRPATRL